MPTFTVISRDQVFVIVLFVMQMVEIRGCPESWAGEITTHTSMSLSLPTFSFSMEIGGFLQAACGTGLHVNRSTGGTALPLIAPASLKHAFQWSYDNVAWLHAWNCLFIGLIWHQASSCPNRVQRVCVCEIVWKSCSGSEHCVAYPNAAQKVYRGTKYLFTHFNCIHFLLYLSAVNLFGQL